VIEVDDLTPKRDYVYVADAIEGILAATQAEPGSVFNLGSGMSYSVEDVILKARIAARTEKPYHGRRKRRKNDLDDVIADITAIKRAVGWEPTTSLDRGLKLMVEKAIQI
jgi:nucleoside-diphosphate-sugar epimerase